MVLGIREDRFAREALTTRHDKMRREEQVVAYASRTMLKRKKNYAITDKEGLALIFAVKHFRPYLHGAHFIIETNHAPLKALKTSRELTGRLARWALIL